MMVTILMATFNGAEYLTEQLHSIIAQSYTDWELIIRDDCSSDLTVAIIEKYVQADSRIKLLPLAGKHGSATTNFSVLFDYARSLGTPYVMFADQDDIWKADKIERFLNFIQLQEQKLEPSLPILVYGGVEYVDAHGKVIPQELKMPDELDFNILLTGNHAYGCTMILNRVLVERIGHIPDNAENHDYWVALVACALGKAVLNPEKLIGYRQHANNVTGNVYRNRLPSRLNRYIKHLDTLLPVFMKNYKMVNAFYAIYKDDLNAETAALVSGYINAYERGDGPLLYFMVRNKLRKLGLMQTFAHYYMLMHLRSKVLRRL
jgi:glycosyltransferase involved in cell wall biosynthesis